MEAWSCEIFIRNAFGDKGPHSIPGADADHFDRCDNPKIFARIKPITREAIERYNLKYANRREVTDLDRTEMENYIKRAINAKSKEDIFTLIREYKKFKWNLDGLIDS